MDFRGVFYDGKAKTRSAYRPGMVFVYPVEPFKNALMVFRRDTDAGICNRKEDAVVFFSDRYGNFSVPMVILNSIVAKIIDHAVKELGYSLKNGRGAGQR